MENKKDIGKAYQDALENHSASPHNRVWENIEKGLDKPKRRTLPFWTIAAGFMLIIPLTIYITKNQFNSDVTPQNIETQNINDSISDNTEDVYDNQDYSNQDESTINEKESIVKNKSNLKNNTTTKNTTAGSTNEASKTNSQNKNLTATSTTIRAASNIDNSLKRTTRKTQGLHSYYSNDNTHLFASQPIILSEFEIIGSFERHESWIVKPKKKRITKDSKNMTLKAYGGLTYFNTLAAGSILDESLQGNKRRGGIGYSFGAEAEFHLTERSSISIGIGQIHLNHTTIAADSIHENIEGRFLSNSPNYNFLDLNNQGSNDISILGNGGTLVDFRHEISYLEIPIRFSYDVIEGNKFKLNANGGMSFLTLMENRIIAESLNGNSLSIGKANNLNKLNLSINLGASLSYPLSDRIGIFTEPVFKYYLKTFNRNTRFKPYSLGLNLGVKYKF